MALKLRILRRGKRMSTTDHTFDVPKFEGDVMNSQVVARKENEILVMSPLAVMTKEQALVHAAWIVALADQTENYTEFRAALKAVLAT
jgi:hypothetical protein